MSLVRTVRMLAILFGTSIAVFQPQAGLHAAPRQPDIFVGHIGGVPVQIPKPYGRFLAYDGDPGLMEKREGPAPARDFRSGIRGFAFEVHYPDMTVRDASAPAAMAPEPISESRWLRVLVWANSDFRVDADTYMSRLAGDIRATGPYKAVKVDEPFHDLQMFVPSKEHPGAAKSKYAGMYGETQYLEVGRNGKALTYIECANSPYASSPCAMYFVLDPAMHASIKVSFRKGLLQHWREIKMSVNDVMLGFAKR